MSVAGRASRVGLGLVVVATLLTLFVGFAHKSLCLMGDGFNARKYEVLCYSDIVPLYRSEGFASGDFPYLDAPNEYPVGTGMLMWSASLFGRGEGDFFLANAVLLSALGVLTSVLLYRVVGARALYFALAPSLALYAFLNWDLLAIALATGATVAFLRRRDPLAGALIGIGVAAKLYPILLLVPFALDRRREGDARAGIRVAGWAGVAWLALNLPFMALAFDRWYEFFRFSAERGVHWATLWFVGCRTLTGDLVCDHVRLVNGLSLVLFAVAALWTWRAKVAREPDVPRWTLAFPLIVLFLLTTKVYSPQYSLWLVPWFALVLPDLRLFAAFEAVDVGMFLTEFSWLGDGVPTWVLEAAILIRAAVLVLVLLAFVRRRTGPFAPSFTPATVAEHRAIA